MSTLAEPYDAVVVGSGPNGLSAAVRLAQAGLSVVVLEANAMIGGGTRSAELTLPGFIHDLCSAVHPLGLGSPFFSQLPLEEHGLKWLQPELPLAHPLDGGQAAVLQRSVSDTAGLLGWDAGNYQRLFGPLVGEWEELVAEFLQPLLHVPSRPLQMARFARLALRSAKSLADGWFKQAPARALLAGLAGHSFLPLEQMPSASFGVVLGLLGHAVGWPSPQGGSQQIATSLAAFLRELGGEIRTRFEVEDVRQLPRARIVLLDLTPRQVLRITGELLPDRYRRHLQNFRYGPGVFKIDYALSGPIPWRSEACRHAGTVHIGGTFEEIASAERQVIRGDHPEQPFVLLAQPTLFDSTRAPAGKHIAWAYCHVPSGSSRDMIEPIENQIERFASGFRDVVLARHSANCAELETSNQNLVNGSIDGGATDLWQLLARPVFSATPYRLPLKGWYLCSASTPPGAGVHGMCGFHAAEAALRDWFS